MNAERELLQRLVELKDERDKVTGDIAKGGAEANFLLAWAVQSQAKHDAAWAEARALLAQPERPQWSSEPPTAPGWYWWRVSETESALTMAHVLLDPARILVVMPFGTPAAMHPGQWCGPLTPPQG